MRLLSKWIAALLLVLTAQTAMAKARLVDVQNLRWSDNTALTLKLAGGRRAARAAQAIAHQATKLGVNVEVSRGLVPGRQVVKLTGAHPAIFQIRQDIESHVSAANADYSEYVHATWF